MLTRTPALFRSREFKSFKGTTREAVGAPSGNDLGGPLAHRLPVGLGEPRHGRQLDTDFIDVARVETASGGSVGIRNQRCRAPSLRRHQEWQTAGRGFVDDQTPGLGKAG